MNHRPVAIINAGRAGTGAATTSSMRSSGWEVVICGADFDFVEQVADATGATACAVDLSSPDDIDRLISSTVERFGAINGLVLNEGLLRPGKLEDISDAYWDTMVSVNLTRPFRLMRAVLPYIVAAKGSIVGVAPAAALRGTGNIPAIVLPMLRLLP